MYAYPDHVLDSTGILIGGEICERAQSLEPGETRAFTFGAEVVECSKIATQEEFYGKTPHPAGHPSVG